jgi:hypothetical protein
MAEQRWTITNSAAAHSAWMTILLQKVALSFLNSSIVNNARRLWLPHCPYPPLPPPRPPAAAPLSKTDFGRYMYDYLHRTSRNVTSWQQQITCQIRSREISVAPRRVNVCSSGSCTEMCDKAYSTGQKGAWSSVWRLYVYMVCIYSCKQSIWNVGWFPAIGSSPPAVRTFQKLMQSELTSLGVNVCCKICNVSYHVQVIM